jgi:hypothetical protein
MHGISTLFMVLANHPDMLTWDIQVEEIANAVCFIKTNMPDGLKRMHL